MSPYTGRKKWHFWPSYLLFGSPLVLVSRCISGRIVPGYGGRGGGRTLRELGVIDGGWLSCPKARIALLLALGGGAGMEETRALFAALCPADPGD